jgi:hypothetical protein
MFKPIGWWISSFDDASRPAPQELVCEWQPDFRAAVVRHLASGRRLESYMGHSWCRFGCGIDAARMGSADLTDGQWIWPEGLAHYVEVHSVGLPQEFIEHVLSCPAPIPVDEKQPIDWDYWTRWCAERRSPTMLARLEERLQADRASAAAYADDKIRKLEEQQATSGDRCRWKGCTRYAPRGKFVCGMHGFSRESIMSGVLNDGFVDWIKGGSEQIARPAGILKRLLGRWRS